MNLVHVMVTPIGCVQRVEDVWVPGGHWNCLGYFRVTGFFGQAPRMRGCVHNNLQSYSSFSTTLKTILWLLAALKLKITCPSKAPCPSLPPCPHPPGCSLLSTEQSPAWCPVLCLFLPQPGALLGHGSAQAEPFLTPHKLIWSLLQHQRSLSSHPQYCMNGIISRVPWVSQLGCQAQESRGLPVLPVI